MWLKLWRTVTISRFLDTYLHRLLKKLLKWWLVLLLALELITVTHYFTTEIWNSQWVKSCTKKNSQNCLWYWKSAHIFYIATSLLALIHSYQPTRLLHSTQDLLTVPRCKTVFGGRRFSVAAPRVWNSLPQKLRKCETWGTFKKHLKTHLFRQDII